MTVCSEMEGSEILDRFQRYRSSVFASINSGTNYFVYFSFKRSSINFCYSYWYPASQFLRKIILWTLRKIYFTILELLLEKSLFCKWKAFHFKIEICCCYVGAQWQSVLRSPTRSFSLFTHQFNIKNTFCLSSH